MAQASGDQREREVLSVSDEPSIVKLLDSHGIGT